MDPPATVALSTQTSSTSRTYEKPTSLILRVARLSNHANAVAFAVFQQVRAVLWCVRLGGREQQASSLGASVTSKLSFPGSRVSGSLTSNSRQAVEPSAVSSLVGGGD